MAAQKQPMPGDSVIYHDESGVAHNALCTTDWGGCINILHLSGNPSEKDAWGRQSKHVGSVSHVSDTKVHGRYWRWSDEKPNEYKPPVSV